MHMKGHVHRDTVNPHEYSVEKIPSKEGKAFVIEHHYSHGIHNGPMTYGLKRAGELVGVCAFATPCSENVRASIYGKERKQEVTELHRLVLLDEIPHNAESFFISRSLKALHADKPHLSAVVSFADATEGHRGVIYQATNAIFYGRSPRARFYLDTTGRLRHPRQNGRNITLRMAAERGWEPVMREGKYRYLFLLAKGKHRRRLIEALAIQPQPYPGQRERRGPSRDVPLLAPDVTTKELFK